MPTQGKPDDKRRDFFMMNQQTVANKRPSPKRAKPAPADLEEIILRCWPQINFRVRKSIGYQDSNWEDVASEILIDSLRAVKEGKFKGNSSIETFIYTITSRRIIDYIRKKYRVLKHLPEQGHPIDPYEYVRKKERFELLARHIKTLKPKYADMLYLYYYMELSRHEIADIFGISAQRVSEILSDAKKSLKLIIKN
jgi:RNA polymerase sigma factor (sigma-70 family)